MSPRLSLDAVALRMGLIRHQVAMAQANGARQTILDYSSVATARDYSAWLTGFMLAGGLPTHVYNHELPRGQWRVVTRPLRLFPLYGVESLSLIFPPGVQDLGGDAGDSRLFLMTGDGRFLARRGAEAPTHRPAVVPVFIDTTVVSMTEWEGRR